MTGHGSGGAPATAATRLRKRLQDGRPCAGALLRMPNEELVEMLAVAGHDFVLIDCEHGPDDTLELRRHLAAADAFGLPALVRTGSDDPGLVLRALDHGAAGIVAPHIDTPEQARALVGSAHYPPLGERGFATYSRAGRYGTTTPQEHRDRLADVIVIAMIESPAAVAAATQILSVEGIDGYLVGTSDLAASSGPDDLPLPEALQVVARAGLETGTWRAELASSPEQGRRAAHSGADLVVHNLTAALMPLLVDLADVTTT